MPQKSLRSGAAATDTRLVSDSPSEDNFPSVPSYEILCKIGSGNMGTVYKARSLANDQLFTIKILHAELAADPVNVRRFEQEAQSCMQLDSPHIVSVYETGTASDRRPYLVMDYLCGTGLDELLDEQGFLSEEEFTAVFTQVCEALKEAHAKGILHRDLKPSNIMLLKGEAGTPMVKLLDFGIARTLQRTAKDGPRVTQTGELIGSPVYMSPEQCLGQKLDERSDLYSLGVVMYEALTGKLPFNADNVVQVILKHINEPPPSMHKIRPDFSVPAHLEAVISRCLMKEPSERFDCIEQILEVLEARKYVEPEVSRRPAAPALTKQIGDWLKGAFTFDGIGSGRAALLSCLALAALLGSVAYCLAAMPQLNIDETRAFCDQKMLAMYHKDWRQLATMWRQHIAWQEFFHAAPSVVLDSYKSATLDLSNCITVNPDASAPQPRLQAGTMVGTVGGNPLVSPEEVQRAQLIQQFASDGLSYAQNHQNLEGQAAMLPILYGCAYALDNRAAQEKYLRQLLALDTRLHIRGRDESFEDWLGELYLDEGRFAEAIPWLEEAAADNHGNNGYPSALEELQRAYDGLHQYEKVDELYKPFLHNANDFGRSYHLRNYALWLNQHHRRREAEQVMNVAKQARQWEERHQGPFGNEFALPSTSSSASSTLEPKD